MLFKHIKGSKNILLNIRRHKIMLKTSQMMSLYLILKTCINNGQGSLQQD